MNENKRITTIAAKELPGDDRENQDLTEGRSFIYYFACNLACKYYLCNSLIIISI